MQFESFAQERGSKAKKFAAGSIKLPYAHAYVAEFVDDAPTPPKAVVASDSTAAADAASSLCLEISTAPPRMRYYCT